MIVRMKKVTLLCTVSSREETLDALRELGVLHLVPIQPPAGADVDRERERLFRVRHALDVLSKHPTAAPSGRAAEEVVRGVWDLLHTRREEDLALERLERERQRIEPFGSFDPRALRRLAEQNVSVRLYAVSRRHPVEVPEGAVKVVIREDKATIYFALVGRGDVQLALPEFRLPEQSLDELSRNIAAKKESLAAIARQFEAFSGDRPGVERLAAEVEERVQYLEARSGMGAARPVVYLTGFCPAGKIDALRAAAASNQWGLAIGEPGAGDRVPTLIRNPKWVRPIRAVFDMIGVVPGYEEIDVSAPFLIFLSLFFAMIVGDAGYGVIFLVLTLWVRRKFPGLPAQPFTLLKIMSVCTIVWGVVTGNYFGILSVPTPLARLRIDWLSEPDNLMLLCFFIGAVHLTVAHAWNALVSINSLRALAQLGWICTTWTMFFAARFMVLGHPFPPVMLTVFTIGVVAIVLFMTPVRNLKTEWFNHVVLPLTLVSSFVDVVSYVRLYAVGVASVAVASSFNAMAVGGVKGFLSGLAAALILFFGHLLNILLSAMGVLVHGVRLNTLEFSSHIGMQWKGFAYRPFARAPQSRTGMPAEGPAV